MKNKVKESRFLEWYFQDPNDLIAFARGILEELLISGKSFITAKTIFDSCGYIPSHICEDDSVEEEYDTSEVDFEVEYYAIGHMSKFIKNGAHRIYSDSYTGSIESIAFKNINGEIVLVVCNPSSKYKLFNIMCSGKSFSYGLNPKSVCTILWE